MLYSLPLTCGAEFVYELSYYGLPHNARGHEGTRLTLFAEFMTRTAVHDVPASPVRGSRSLRAVGTVGVDDGRALHQQQRHCALGTAAGDGEDERRATVNAAARSHRVHSQTQQRREVCYPPDYPPDRNCFGSGRCCC